MYTFENFPFLAQSSVLHKLAEISNLTTLSSKERMKYDKCIQTLRDAHATYQHAFNEGYVKGFSEGYAKGRRECTMKIAKTMLSAGEPLSKISLYTGLSEEEISKL